MILVDALSDQRVEDLLNIQNAFVHMGPSHGTQDCWEWEPQTFSVRGALGKDQGGQFVQEQDTT